MLWPDRLSRPIYRLASAAHRMAQGDLSTRVDVSGTEEQQVLSFAFNQLASQIQSQVIQLQDKTEELEEKQPGAGANPPFSTKYSFEYQYWGIECGSGGAYPAS